MFEVAMMMSVFSLAPGARSERTEDSLIPILVPIATFDMPLFFRRVAYEMSAARFWLRAMELTMRRSVVVKGCSSVEKAFAIWVSDIPFDRMSAIVSKNVWLRCAGLEPEPHG